MKAGDKIRVQIYMMGHAMNTEDHTIEEYYHCLGFFRTEDDRTAGKFTPLCQMTEPGPDSEQKYISNYGEYHTNLVQSWMDLPNN